MAIPADQTAQGGAGKALSDLDLLRGEFNKLVVQLRVLTAKLDLDAGVTDVNYAALVTAADAASPSKVLVTY